MSVRSADTAASEAEPWGCRRNATRSCFVMLASVWHDVDQASETQNSRSGSATLRRRSRTTFTGEQPRDADVIRYLGREGVEIDATAAQDEGSRSVLALCLAVRAAKHSGPLASARCDDALRCRCRSVLARSK
jgi:hypothetical protein